MFLVCFENLTISDFISVPPLSISRSLYLFDFLSLNLTIQLYIYFLISLPLSLSLYIYNLSIYLLSTFFSPFPTVFSHMFYNIKLDCFTTLNSLIFQTPSPLKDFFDLRYKEALIFENLTSFKIELNSIELLISSICRRLKSNISKIHVENNFNSPMIF